jgi:hypothetical protein
MTRTIHFWLFALALAGCTDTTTEAPQSIADYCATSSLPCPMTWTAAQDPTSWGGCANRNANSNPLLLGTCARVLVAEMWGVDASTNYYYDASTGQLISMTSHHESGRTEDVCFAGDCPTEACNDPAPRDVCP